MREDLLFSQCLQAYIIRISYGIALENTEYGESDLIYGYGFWSSLGHLCPPPRKKGKSMGQESPGLVGVFDVK